MSRIGAAVALAVGIAAAGAPAAVGADAGGTTPAERPPHLGEQVYDLLVLRPLGVVQLAVGAVALVPSYPIAWLFDGEGEVVRACLTDPVDRTFRRPLGRL